MKKTEIWGKNDLEPGINQQVTVDLRPGIVTGSDFENQKQNHIHSNVIFIEPELEVLHIRQNHPTLIRTASSVPINKKQNGTGSGFWNWF